MNADMVAIVLEVACLTEDRTTVEQRAMLDLALWADAARAKFAGRNTPTPPRLTDTVRATWEPSEGRRIDLTVAQVKQLEGLHARFVPCDKCGVIRGRHAAACLTDDLSRAALAPFTQEGK